MEAKFVFQSNLEGRRQRKKSFFFYNVSIEMITIKFLVNSNYKKTLCENLVQN